MATKRNQFNQGARLDALKARYAEAAEANEQAAQPGKWMSFNSAGYKARERKREQASNAELRAQLAVEAEETRSAEEMRGFGASKSTALTGAEIGLRDAGVDPTTMGSLGYLLSQSENPTELKAGMAQAQQAIASPSFSSTAQLALNRVNEEAARKKAQFKVEQDRRGVDYEIAKNNLATGTDDLEAIEAGTVPPTRRIEVAMNWADDWASITKPHRQVLASAEQASMALNNPSSTSGFVVISALARALDPGSTVRQAEGELVSNSTGALQSVIDKYNKALGENFSEQSVADFRATLMDVVSPWAIEYERIHDGYKDRAIRGKINPEDIFTGTYNPGNVKTWKGVSLRAE